MEALLSDRGRAARRVGSCPAGVCTVLTPTRRPIKAIAVQQELRHPVTNSRREIGFGVRNSERGWLWRTERL